MGTDTLPTDPPAGEGARLDGWKEIAAHLNRHVATVRRWEKTEALPVHRHLHDKLGSVYAFRGELDVWWRSRRARLEAENTAGGTPADGAADEATNRLEPQGWWVAARVRFGSGRLRRPLVGALLALALVTVAYAVSRAGPGGRTEIRSLAVLPLQDLSADPAQEFFADGMTDAVITSLAQIHGLRVISRTSAMRFKGPHQPLPQVARELGVDAIVEGSVQRAGNRMRLTIQLVDVVSDHHIWARAYERELSDVLKLQGELARTVADEIRARIGSGAHARPARTQTLDPVAHEAYLLGRYHAWKMNDDDLKLAIAHFTRAIQIDPRYAAAHADLSLAWQYRSVFAATPFSESEAPARTAAQAALALDEHLAPAHLAAGHFKYAYELDFAGAERDLRRAVDLDPNSVDAHYYSAKLLLSLGRFSEAIHHMERARQLDPLSSSVASFFGRILYTAGKYEEAVPHLKRAIELEPRNRLAYTRLNRVYEEMGRHDEPLAHHSREYQRGGGSPHLLRMATVQARMGRREEARRTFARADPLECHPLDLAEVHAALGENDEAFRRIEEAIHVRDGAARLFLKVDPRFFSLHADARWKDVLQRMHLPQ